MIDSQPAFRVLCPVRHTGTEELLPEFLGISRTAPATALWLVPSVRAAGEIRRILAHTSPALLSPMILSPSNFADELLTHNDRRFKPLIPIQQRIILDEVLSEIYGNPQKSYFGRIAETRGFADAALGMIREFKELGIDPQILRLTLEGLPEADNSRLNRLQECAQIYELFQTRLRNHSLLDPEDSLRRAADFLDQQQLDPYRRIRDIFVSGFTSLTRGTSGMLFALGRRGIRITLAIREDLPKSSSLSHFIEAQQRQNLGEMITIKPPLRRTEWIAARNGREHLRRVLFTAEIPRSDSAEDIEILEAPGQTGEARMIARRIRDLLTEGASPDQILVTGRDLRRQVELLQEVFAEYDIPVDCEGAEPLSHNHAVAFLLRAVRVPEDDWPFASVTSLLRSSWFRPEWPEAGDDSEMPRHAEALLRLLGEPRSRDAYLRAVRIWAESPPEGLEDEQAEEGRRRRKHRLAKECKPFLDRFFRAWDEFPEVGTVFVFSRWLRDFASDLGLLKTVRDSAEDHQALEGLFAELDRWTARTHSGTVPLRQNQFRRLLSSLTSSGVIARSHRGPHRVRILSAESARLLEADWLFITGLGEGSFPNTAPPQSLLDDGDRHELRKLDLPFPETDERLLAEQSLFRQLVTLPKKGLILSYPAVDPRGMPLLPSGFLRHLRECFAPNSLKVQHQQMLIESWLRDAPISQAEQRVQFARFLNRGQSLPAAGLKPDLIDALKTAKTLAENRFGVTSFTLHDGWLTTPAVTKILQEKFGPEKVFSPTALESYVTCPFRFLLEQVLHLQPLEEPDEEIEATRRGSAFHRALARFHRTIHNGDESFLKSGKVPEAIANEMLTELQAAIQEYIDRAPSPASRVLWQLEAQRLRRSAAKYGGHWETFLQPWKPKGAIPLPTFFEADFGMKPDSSVPINGEILPSLVLNLHGIEVRIGGRIDRIDVAEMPEENGFWIIDYKTGRSTSYTSSSMARMEKLQLPLYAMAVERIFFPGRKARPLGLAYWLVTDGGSKRMMPEGRGKDLDWLESPEKWEKFRTQLEEWVIQLVTRIREGQFPLKPKDEDNCTRTCAYGEICRIGQSRGRKTSAESNAPNAE